MRRRSFLASSAALLGTGFVGTTPAREASFGPLGTLELPGTMDAVVDGDVAYVAVSDGFATVDLADPSTPSVLAERRDLLAGREDGPLRDVFDAGIDGDRLVVAGPANANPRAFNGFVVYDVADPADPQQVGVHPTSFPIHNLDVADGVAYLTSQNGSTNPVVAVDIGTDTPTEVGRWSPADYDAAWRTDLSQLPPLHDVTVHDGQAYLAYWDAGTWIVDVSDPAAISFVGRVRGPTPSELSRRTEETSGYTEYIQTPGNDHFVDVDEDASTLAVGAEAWDVRRDERVGGPGGIELYDISTPTEPTFRGRIDAPPTDDPTRNGTWTTAHNFDFSAGRLYSSWYQGGVRVHDVSDPANPTELAAWADRDAATFFTARRPDDQPCFVATNMGPGTTPNPETGSVYTFPLADASSGQPMTTPDGSPPTSTGGQSTTTPDGSPPTSTGSQSTTTPDGSPPTSTGSQSTPSGSGERLPTTSAPGTDNPRAGTETTGGIGPGFGPLAALSALGLGAWYARRRDED